MRFIKYKKPITLSILFFMPVVFLLFLYPSTHNYQPLEIVKETVAEIKDDSLQLKDHITVLAFYGKRPMDKAIAAANLKELIYDKFKGFKRFQVIAVTHIDAFTECQQLKKEISRYEDLKFWHFSLQDENSIKQLFASLKTQSTLDENLASQQVFIIDKELNQRGRLDDREEREKKREDEVYGLFSYNCIEVAEIKDKLSEDLRILFTEYRQRRKGNFDSDSRRSQDLKSHEEN